jgi:hypothetical protein
VVREVTLLYAAFAVVALWLLGELLLQRRAPLHWRALALVGFLVLVAGVVQGMLPLIGAGVLAFGAGQALATRAVKQPGGAAYWSLVAAERVPLVGRLFAGEEAAPEAKRRSRAARPEPVAEPIPASAPEPAVETEAAPTGAMEATAVFQADEYAVEGDGVYYAQPSQEQYQAQEQAAYYAYTEQASYPDPYAQAYPPEYPEYGQYQDQQQYAAYQSYESYEQQYAQSYGSGYAQHEVAAQPQSGYDYEQAGYYVPEAQYHAPQG